MDRIDVVHYRDFVEGSRERGNELPSFIKC
jgi:hypothetical protein